MISHLLLLGPCLLHHQLMILWWSCLTLFWENRSQHEGTPPSSHRQPAAFCHSLPLSSQWRKWPSSHPRPALAPSSYSLKDLTLKWPLLFALLLISSSGFFPIAHRQCISLWTWPFLPPPPHCPWAKCWMRLTLTFSFKVEAIQGMLFPYTQLLIWRVAGTQTLAI